MLAGSESADATDILYMAFGGEGDQEEESDIERLGVVLVAFQDGKVDVCLDVEKVEAKWEHRQVCWVQQLASSQISHETPAFAS